MTSRNNNNTNNNNNTPKTAMIKTTSSSNPTTSSSSKNNTTTNNNSINNNNNSTTTKHLITVSNNASSHTNNDANGVIVSPTTMSHPGSRITCITFDRRGFNNQNTNYNNSKNNINYNNNDDGDTESEISSISDMLYYPSTTLLSAARKTIPSPPPATLRVKLWDKKKLYSEFVQDGLRITNPSLITGSNSNNNIIMLYESPSCTTQYETSFFNGQTFKYYDYPPSPGIYKSILAPCRYSMMNGNIYSSYIQNGNVPNGLLEHWILYIPTFIIPTFTSIIDMKHSIIYAYLPIEHIPNHVNNPHVHYHVSGKDILHLMTRRTPKLLTNTRDRRPCICKMTHSMGNKGIFIIRNDDDEKRFESILSNTGNPTFVVTEYIESKRSISCHFFIHPNSYEITWFGSNENYISKPYNNNNNKTSTNAKGNGRGTCSYSHDTVIIMKEQEILKKLQLPFVIDVVKYFQARDFWGFCGIDVIFDTYNNGYLVDVNPRVTGSLPAIMVSYKLYDIYQYEYCLYRRGCQYAYNGSSQQLLNDVAKFNTVHHEINHESMILVTGFVEIDIDDIDETAYNNNNNKNDDSIIDFYDKVFYQYDTKSITSSTATSLQGAHISSSKDETTDTMNYSTSNTSSTNTNNNNDNNSNNNTNTNNISNNNDDDNDINNNDTTTNNNSINNDCISASFCTENKKKTLVQLAVYGKRSLEECEAILNQFAPYMGSE